MREHPALAEFPWNEAVRQRGDLLNEGMVSIVAFDADGRPRPAGSGFLIWSEGERAVGATAAHVFDEIARFQSRRPDRNEYLIPAPFRVANKLDTRPERLMATTFVTDPVPAFVPGTFQHVAWDSGSELAFFELKLRVPNGSSPRYCLVDRTIPEVGEVVAMLGYADSDANAEPTPETGKPGSFALTIKQRLVLRVGRVTAHHAAHILCRAPCVETTIPIFSGMSGCLVTRYGEGMSIRAFGVASSDPEGDKQNRAIPGQSIVALLDAKVDVSDASFNRVLLTLANAKLQSAETSVATDDTAPEGSR
jgi:hypothetical protein